jgi:predicted ATPase
MRTEKSIRVNGLVIKDTVGGHIIGRMEKNTKGNGKMINWKEKGLFIIRMVVSMKVSLEITEQMDMVYFIRVMVINYMKVNGKMINFAVAEHNIFRTEQ